MAVAGSDWRRGPCEERQGAARQGEQELQDRIALLEENDKKILLAVQHQREDEELHRRADAAEEA